jgi:hypothetical protein
VKLFTSRPWVFTQTNDPLFWLFNSWPQSGPTTSSTPTFEPFRDEKFRFKRTYLPTATDPILPVGVLKKFDSTALLAPADQELQVLGDRVVYPQTDFSAGYRPLGQPNYSTIPGLDPLLGPRQYVRMFDTGIARSTGKIRVKGAFLASFAAQDPFTGNLATDHPGGLVLALQVPGPGVTDFLDLGRPLGNPDLNVLLPLRGCQTAVQVISPSEHIISYSTQAFTGDNGIGEYPLIFTAALINGLGLAVFLDEIEWLPP